VKIIRGEAKRERGKKSKWEALSDARTKAAKAIVLKGERRGGSGS
jgi:rRNA maturation protein Rpf1